jgi:predicted phosphodiesterase
MNEDDYAPRIRKQEMQLDLNALRRRKSGKNTGGVHFSIWSLFFLSILLAVADSARAGITKGPVLLRTYLDRVALIWETDRLGPGKVQCTGPGGFESETASLPCRIDYSLKESERSVTDRSAFVHKVWIDNLSPDTRYTYRIIDAGEPSPEYGFRTAPSEEGAGIRFVVYGDSRTYPDRHRRIIEQIIKKKPDFVVNVGDLVSRGNYYEQWGPELFEPIRGLAESVPFYAVKGNHDTGNMDFFEKLLVPPGEESNFSFDFGPVHYYGLDNYGGEVSELLERLEEDFSSLGGLWNFVTYHVPSLNIGGHASDWGFPLALPALSSAGVDFVVTGHSHIYERFRPVAPPEGKTGSFVTYITSGGGGALPYGVEPSLFLAGAESLLHFCLFEIKGGQLNLEVIDDQGRTIDTLSVRKTGGVLDRKYTNDAVAQKQISLYQHLFRTVAMTRQNRPESGQPVRITFRLSPSPSGEAFKTTLALACDENRYISSGEKTFKFQVGDAFRDVELTATPLAGASAPSKKPPEESLYVECRYEGPTGRGAFKTKVRYLNR